MPATENIHRMTAIALLGRRVRAARDMSFEMVGGPLGRRIGNVFTVKEGAEGNIRSAKGKLTVQFDTGQTVELTRDDVTLVPR